MSEYCTHGQHHILSDCYAGRFLAQQRQEMSVQPHHQGAAGMRAGFPRPTTSTACKDADRPGVPKVRCLALKWLGGRAWPQIVTVTVSCLIMLFGQGASSACYQRGG